MRGSYKNSITLDSPLKISFLSIIIHISAHHNSPANDRPQEAWRMHVTRPAIMVGVSPGSTTWPFLAVVCYTSDIYSQEKFEFELAVCTLTRNSKCLCTDQQNMCDNRYLDCVTLPIFLFGGGFFYMFYL